MRKKYFYPEKRVCVSIPLDDYQEIADTSNRQGLSVARFLALALGKMLATKGLGIHVARTKTKVIKIPKATIELLDKLGYTDNTERQDVLYALLGELPTLLRNDNNFVPVRRVDPNKVITPIIDS